mmetsp:Transcript_32461/g.63419  ORF Transcript_32461/g.63419 Transcript_32461/m.63419 type:complete len:308 (+) Transcript_32461:264-1187(+)|eukprot:CAMPEP_0173383790 /NCGR_PEP_ID=MMETSP1356-20130122/6359_1 /TAXON_ID=77927 ORGANISM="Hemiselmis virescens, Strain PCC157" /NCGR_SAMPLE_ID=MMETSP1356 /ASSEMBLY_ACC=CAM_ASM_000847 /LENGTH=307 /DNA_ID=CAMNT_0014338817 /DNA_START=203 /DNA_END=1126 /DNA_ORIENTATION=+
MPLKQRAAAGGAKKGFGFTKLHQQRNDMYKRVQAQLIEPSITGAFVAWLPIFITGAAVYLGMHDLVEGVTRPLKPIPIMVTYNYIFKLMGPVFPFLILAIRVLLIITCITTLTPGAPLLNVNDQRITFVFVAVTTMRLLVYGATLLSSRESMSDHIFMGVSLVVLARIEMHASLDILMGDPAGAIVLKVQKPQKKGEDEKGDKDAPKEGTPPASPPTLGRYRLLFLIPFTLSLLTIVLTHCNNYVTARYFHSKEESQAAVLTGIMLFEAPCCMWLMQSSGYGIFEIFKTAPPQPPKEAVKELSNAAE